MIVIDLETTIHNDGPDAVGDWRASVYHPSNEIVIFGVRPKAHWFGDVLGSKLWVFQNAAFDFQYLLKFYYGQVVQWLEDGGHIWDTSIAEYVLMGQQSKYADLDSLSLKYGGTLKDSRIKDLWEAGVQTEDIDRSLLTEYNEADLSNTELVHYRQYAEAEKRGLLPLLNILFEDRLFTILMEWNGMRFDREGALAQVVELRKELSTLEHGIQVQVASELPQGVVFNPGSGKQVGLLLFGGEFKYYTNEPKHNEDGSPVVFKTGPHKGKLKLFKTEQIWSIPPRNEEYATPTETGGGFCTDEATIEKVLKSPRTQENIRKLCELLLAHRRLGKDISTYYEGYSKLTWPTDGCIHPSINHTATETGRQSCSKPNLQNCSRKET